MYGHFLFLSLFHCPVFLHPSRSQRSPQAQSAVMTTSITHPPQTRTDRLAISQFEHDRINHRPAVRLQQIIAQWQPNGSDSIPMIQSRVTSGTQPTQQHSTTPADDSTSPLDAERAHPAFDIRELMNYLNGGEAITAIRELVQASIQEDPILNDAHRYDIARPEARRRTMAKIAQVVGVIRGRNSDQEQTAAAASTTASSSENTKKNEASPSPLNSEDQSSSRAGAGRAFEDAFYGTLAMMDPSWSIRIGVHFGLFQGAIMGAASDAQRAKYARDIQEMRMIGCFAMTEMGHGSYVQGLETTATFDKATQEFVIHTPTITATKWWIGMAGQTATHAAVFAKLIIDGQSHGIHTFIVPIRSLTTGEPEPNVEVGDMGAKQGRNGLDNGFIRFHHKRVPRDAMLSRWANVDEKGHFTPPPNKTTSYIALLGTRVELFRYCSDELKKALCISIRYALVRKQFLSTSKPASGETKLLDYPTHQIRLFPILAHTFAFHFSAVHLQKVCDAAFKDLEGNLAELPQLHATSSGMKAIGTWYTNDAIEVARQTLGGQGYSSYSVLPGARNDWAVMCTWEGDNTVLSLQCANFLIKQCAKLKQQGVTHSRTKSSVTDYLTTIDLKKPCGPVSDETFLKPAFQLRCFQHRSARRIQELTTLVANEVHQHHVSHAVAYERFSPDALVITRLHVYVFILQCFHEGVEKAPSNEIKTVLKLLCDLFVLYEFQEHIGDFLEDGFFTSTHVTQIRRLVRTLLSQLRPHALPLIDSFGLPDFLVGPLGQYDGDIYRALFDVVKSAPDAQAVPTYFQELIRPLTDRNYQPNNQ